MKKPLFSSHCQDMIFLFVADPVLEQPLPIATKTAAVTYKMCFNWMDTTINTTIGSFSSF